MTPRGWSILEILVVLAILAIVFALGMAVLRPPPSRHAAVQLAGALTTARLRALAGGAPTALVVAADGRSWERRVGAPSSDAATTCGAGVVDDRLDLTPTFPGVVVASGAEAGIVWFPTGWGRTCAGGAVFNRRIVLSGPRANHAVVVSSAGRVRWERYP